MPLVINTIVPKLVSIPKVRGYLLQAMIQTGNDMIRDMGKTTATWKHQPVFTRYMRYSGGHIWLQIATNDAAWNYLDHGTKERWAVMSNPFEAKTSPGWIGSRVGVGQAVLKGSSHMKKARPGIESRMWSRTIAAKNQPKFDKRIYDAVVKGLVP